MSKRATREVEYDLKSAKLPYLSGWWARLFAALVESPLRGLLIPGLLRNSGVTWFLKLQIDEPPTFYPVNYPGTLATKAGVTPEIELPDQSPGRESGFHFNTVHDYARAYREGKTTPEEVAYKLLETIRFMTSANLTGLPAISFPAGYNDAGLPIGLQAIGGAWQEHTLLRLALAAGQVVKRRAPEVFYNLLAD